MFTKNPTKPQRSFYLAWVVVSVISVPLAWAITLALISQLTQIVGDTIQVAGQRHITEDYLAPYVLFPTLGLLSGLLQSSVLRRYLAHMGWWILATTLGWCLPLFLILLSPPVRLQATWMQWLFIGLLGGMIALPQWLVLHQHTHQAAWWLFASGLGWGMTRLITGETISGSGELLMVGFAPALATALALWFLLERLPLRHTAGGVPA